MIKARNNDNLRLSVILIGAPLFELPYLLIELSFSASGTHNFVYTEKKCIVYPVVALRFFGPLARNNTRAPLSSAGKKTKFYCTVALFRLDNIHFH